MNCPICHTSNHSNARECVSCGESMLQWNELKTNAAVFLNEGHRTAKKGNALSAALCYAKALVLDPKNPEALRALGLTLADEGEPAEAAFYLNRFLSENSGEDAPEVSAALEKIQQSTTEGPTPIPFLKMNAKFGDIPENWVSVFAYENSWKTAQSSADQLLSDFVGDQDFSEGPRFYLRGLLDLTDGNTTSARENFAKSLEKEEAFALNYLIYLDALSHELDDAEYEAVDLENVATALEKQGETQLSQILIRHAIKISGAEVDTNLLEKWIAVEEAVGRNEDIESVLGNLLKPESEADLHITYARACVQLGKTGPLQKKLKGATKKHNDCRLYLYLANVQKKPAKMLKLLNKGVALEDQNPDHLSDLFRNIGVILKEEGKDSDAIAAWEKAVKLSPKHADLVPYLTTEKANEKTAATKD